jgi:hypothetical protein
MNGTTVAIFAVFISFAELTVVGGQQADEALELFELPKFTQPPELDGIRGAGEWANALMLECSASQVERDRAEYGIMPNKKFSPISANQLSKSSGEDANVAGTDADVSALIWHAWDDEGLYYIAEVRDNVRDVEEAIGQPQNWWERDGLSLYVDLLDSNDRNEALTSSNNFTSMNIIHFTAAPQHSSPETITWEVMIEGERTRVQDPELIDGFTYGFRDALDEFGGEADYTIEGKFPWETLMRFQLPTRPGVGTEMGFSWILVDPDGGQTGFEGQLQCWGLAENPAGYSTWIFSDKPAGPPGDTAVSEDAWGRIKLTFMD